jgi:hypothetical protein
MCGIGARADPTDQIHFEGVEVVPTTRFQERSES